MRRLLLLAIVICGCTKPSEPEHRQAVPVDQVPSAIMKVAKEKFPEVKFDTAWKLDNGAIEVRGKAKTGKIHEVEVSSLGEVVETN
jgi:hypothetical protein